MVMLLPALGGTGHADPGDDKNRIDQQLGQAGTILEAATDRARQAGAEHDAATALLPGAENAAADAKGRAIGAAVAARQAQRDSDDADAAQRINAGAYHDAAAAVDRGRAGVSAFVAAAYRGSGFLMANTILESRSPSDFATRIGYLDRVAAEQQRALDTLTAARMTAKQRSDTTLLASQRAERAADNARRSLQTAQAAQVAAEQSAAKVRTLIAQTAEAAAVADQERAVVLARYAQLQAESDGIAAQLRTVAAQEAANARGRTPGPANKSTSGQTPSLSSSGARAFFVTPVLGRKSSNFGMRFDPYFHVWQLHAGVDLAAAGGSPIKAAAAGRVIRAGPAGPYGNYTCLYHGEDQGKGVATCYAHQSQILVSVGQTVSQGQVIGRVGTTGASTGNHLHFEVRLDGRPVDPLGFLPACLC
jgi:murein DD-endopeptidase MepM/ murein hydrolase activator NlpD